MLWPNKTTHPTLFSLSFSDSISTDGAHQVVTLDGSGVETLEELVGAYVSEVGVVFHGVECDVIALYNHVNLLARVVPVFLDRDGQGCGRAQLLQPGG